MIKKPEIETMLVISTGHVTQDDLINLKLYYQGTVLEHPNGYGTIIRVSHDFYGVEEKNLKLFSPECLKIIKTAKEMKFNWINFDRDGETYPQLKVFDW